MDEGLNGRVEYHLVRGDDHGHFVLDSDVGRLRVASSLDREQVTVRAAFCHMSELSVLLWMSADVNLP